MAGADIEYDRILSHDGSFEHSIDLTMEDGSPFPFAQYAAEYAVARDGCMVLWLDQDGGIAVDAETGTITFSGVMPAPGLYAHALRFRHLATGKVMVFFDGTLTITEGCFR